MAYPNPNKHGARGVAAGYSSRNLQFYDSAGSTILELDYTSPSGGPNSDWFAIVPPSEILSIPVTHIAYTAASLTVGSQNLDVQQATDSTAGATALWHIDLSDLECRTTAGKGALVNSFSAFWTLTSTNLTAGPSIAVVSQTFGAAATAAAAPTTAATLGGTITSTPASTQTVIPTAGNYFTTLFSFGTPFRLNSALERVYVEISFPCGIGSVVQLAGCSVGFTQTTY